MAVQKLRRNIDARTNYYCPLSKRSHWIKALGSARAASAYKIIWNRRREKSAIKNGSISFTYNNTMSITYFNIYRESACTVIVALEQRLLLSSWFPSIRAFRANQIGRPMKNSTKLLVPFVSSIFSPYRTMRLLEYLLLHYRSYDWLQSIAISHYEGKLCHWSTRYP